MKKYNIPGKWIRDYRETKRVDFIEKSEKNEFPVLWLKFHCILNYVELFVFLLALQAAGFRIIVDFPGNYHWIIFAVSCAVVFVCWENIKILADIWDKHGSKSDAQKHKFVTPCYWGKRKCQNLKEKNQKKYFVVIAIQIAVFFATIILINWCIMNWYLPLSQIKIYGLVDWFCVSLICILVQVGIVIIGYGIQNIFAVWKGTYWGHIVIIGMVIIGIFNIVYAKELYLYFYVL